MESEKVKEIKKALECCADSIKYGCEGCPYHKSSSDCQELLIWDMQTYINELESENKELKRYKLDWLNSEKMHLQADMEDTEFELFCANKSLNKVRANNQQLKDRIAELEKEIRENAFYSKGYAQGIKNTYEVVIPDKLKQFAERLKEKAKQHYEDDTLRDFTLEYGDVEDTLKEFIND